MWTPRVTPGSTHRAAVACVALALAATGAWAGTASVVLEPIASNIARPVAMAHANDGSGRLFIAEQRGIIRIWDGSTILATPFLDIDSLVSCCGEQGLLGLAFHPDHESNGHFFVYYTDNGGDTVVARYTVSADPNVADPASSQVVLNQSQPYSNHNGGQIAFGPDRKLYIGLGDGGSGGDPLDSGQDLLSWLGAILRLDVDSLPYSIPPDNPFVGNPDALDEIWAWGLRNPWRFSFDRTTGDLFIGDVGQGSWEEVNLQPAASAGGENYGWRLMEGNHCYNPPTDCNDGSLILPVLEYSHGSGRCSINGGYRYRGLLSYDLYGDYIFGDYCTGEIWAATVDATGAWSSTLLTTVGASFSLTTFGEDEDGEIYVGSIAGGMVYKIVDTAPVELLFVDGFESGDTSAWADTVP